MLADLTSAEPVSEAEKLMGALRGELAKLRERCARELLPYQQRRGETRSPIVMRELDEIIWRIRRNYRPAEDALVKRINYIYSILPPKAFIVTTA